MSNGLCVERDGFSGLATKTRKHEMNPIVRFPIESVDSLTATVDNQGEMFLAAATLVLISVGINLPTVTG
jgi:hypothetical protein